MGIYCQINLCKSAEGTFKSGDIISGVIKYNLDEPVEFEKITTSLKGIGSLFASDTTSKVTPNYRAREVYVDIDAINNNIKSIVPAGSYEVKFSFQLPEGIPPSFKFKDMAGDHLVSAKIKYYIRIKFEKNGWLNSNKHFRKEITVKSLITPKLPMEPVIHGTEKKISGICNPKNKTIGIKGNILNSVITTGGKIKIQYEIMNNTKIDIKGIETKLMELNKFPTFFEEAKAYEDIPCTVSKSGKIRSGQTTQLNTEIDVPADKFTFEQRNIVTKLYVVRLTAILPFPHRNFKFDIPVQVGDLVYEDKMSDLSDSPPSYWEAMDEFKDDEKEKL